MNRTKLLSISTVVLLVFALIYHIWANWGLVTIHANKMPLGQVIASMERQAHAKIQTDLPSDTPVDMNVVKVHLTDALETLSVVTESRWRLLYFAAGDKSTLKAGEDAWFGGQTPDGWKMVSFPMGQAYALTDSAEDEAPPDPRTNIWTPKTAAPAQIQAFFTDAAALTDAGFAFPTDWNPTVNSAPAAGTVDHAIPKLVSSAGGRQDAIFFLSKAGPRGPAGGGGDGPTIGADMDLMDEHVQAEISRLPPEEKAEAQSNYSTQRAFFTSLAAMPPDQRMAAFMAHMQDPAFQQMMMDRQDARDARMSHDQRMQRMQNYVDRKMTAMGASH